MLLKDKVALITAGGSGMGRAGAERFAAEGAHVIVVDFNEANAAATVDGITAAGGSASAEICDVRDLGALKALAEKVEREYGALHVLYNNVGIPGAAGLELTQDEWDLGIEVNARASSFLSGYLTSALKAAGGASVLFTSSTSGLIGSPFSPMYSFTKGGIIAMVRSMALAWAADGIRVTRSRRGRSRRPGCRRSSAPTTPRRSRRARRRSSRPSRWAGPASRRRSPAWRCSASDLSSYVTGVTIPVDGAITAK